MSERIEPSQERRPVWSLFHELWGTMQIVAAYRKTDWIQLQRELEQWEAERDQLRLLHETETKRAQKAEGELFQSNLQLVQLRLALDEWKAKSDRHESERESFRLALQEAQALAERLKLEAQIHAQEARTQKSTVHEIYQLVSGGNGEPGDWNGAEPVRKFIDAQKLALQIGAAFSSICERFKLEEK